MFSGASIAPKVSFGGLAKAIGSQPYFLDPSEHDSYSSAVDILPSVISAAFVDTTANSDDE